MSAPAGAAAGSLIAERIKVKGTDREISVLGPEGVEGLRGLAAQLLGAAPPQAQADVSGLLAHLGSARPKAGVAAQLLLSVAVELEDGEARKRALEWVEKLES